ncbi:MAG: hypothetical protein HOO99_09905 [Hyphomicrobiaceae bacterium]|nr:hypothetical protein [Hyphomicrobiaceae bacterium]
MKFKDLHALRAANFLHTEGFVNQIFEVRRLRLKDKSALDLEITMRKLWNAVSYILMVSAATVAGFLATDQSLAGQAKALPAMGNGILMAIVGVLAGLLLAWGWRINWRAMPMRLRYWLVLQRKRFWWTTAAAASIGVLLFY